MIGVLICWVLGEYAGTEKRCVVPAIIIRSRCILGELGDPPRNQYCVGLLENNRGLFQEGLPE